MKVLMILGSPRQGSNTEIALKEMAKIFEQEGVETQLIWIGNLDIPGCKACNYCSGTGECVFGDIVCEAAKKFEEADGLVVGTPVYYGSANGTTVNFLQRLFFSTHFSKTMKVGCGVAVARRGGLTATWDELNKFFGISGMPIASGQYWNGVHGLAPGEAVEDEEGLQQMRTLARNMTFLMKAIRDAKEKYGLPEKEAGISTNFVR